MNILIIEDDENKISQVSSYLQSLDKNIVITVKRSYRSGIVEILENEYEYIFLDMSLPSFDLTSGQSGGRFRSYAGVDILDEMKRNDKLTKTIVLTQYDVFGEGENRTTLHELKEFLSLNYSENYVGTVYYNASLFNWKDEIKEKLFTCGGINKNC